MDNKLRNLFVAMLVVSVAALGVAAVLGAEWPVWVRGGAVAAASAWLISLTGQARRGSRSAYLRIRWISMIAPLGIVLIIVAPDSGFPVWMKAEQGVVGLLLIAVAVLVNRPAVRQAYARRGKLG
ncbi:hypothetical protein [Nonomuraea sediminis]|uniref:hypothetical protein n=1 Tax=Nonomuraea sediminis TaxID=2835864 RepID=UPI001BDD78FF|nr:hypothetical protein [Nonomuraea sediminis]